MTDAIIVKNLTKTFGDVTAVNDVSFSVKKGELFGLLGPNGSGKTTMIKMLTGQIKPTQGEITVQETDVLKNPILTREVVGIIPEQPPIRGAGGHNAAGRRRGKMGLQAGLRLAFRRHKNISFLRRK